MTHRFPFSVSTVEHYNVIWLTRALSPQEDYLIAAPVMKWISVEDTPETTEANLVNSSTLLITFNPLCTSHGDAYTCEAKLDIPQAGIIALTSSTTENLIIQSESFYFCNIAKVH